MVDPRLYCNSCSACGDAATNCCEKFGFLGLSGGGGGGYSEVVAVDAKNIHVLPDNVNLAHAALIEPLAVALHAVQQAGVASFEDQVCLIIGGGPVGLAILIILRAWGAKLIFVSEPSLARRQQAQALSSECIDPTKDKVGDKIRSLTNGKGASVAFDCAGVQSGIQAGFDALSRRGVYVNVAGWEGPVRLFEIYPEDDLTNQATVESPSSRPTAQGVVAQRIDVLHRRGF